MKRIIALSAIFFALCFLDTAEAEVSLKAEVDKTSIATEESLTYKLTIASSDKKTPQPKLPNFEGFSILSSVQSSTMSFQGNKIKTILVYAITLAPTAIGKFKIEPASVKIKDKAYSTDTFEIEVKPSLPEEAQPESEQPQITL